MFLSESVENQLPSKNTVGKLLSHQISLESQEENVVKDASPSAVLETCEVTAIEDPPSSPECLIEQEEKSNDNINKDSHLQIDIQELPSTQGNQEKCIDSENHKHTTNNSEKSESSSISTSVESKSSDNQNVECANLFLEQQNSDTRQIESDASKLKSLNVPDEEIFMKKSEVCAIDSSSKQQIINDSSTNGIEDIQENEEDDQYNHLSIAVAGWYNLVSISIFFIHTEDRSNPCV